MRAQKDADPAEWIAGLARQAPLFWDLKWITLITLVTYLDGHPKHLLQPVVPMHPTVVNHRSPVLRA